MLNILVVASLVKIMTALHIQRNQVIIAIVFIIFMHVRYTQSKKTVMNNNNNNNNCHTSFQEH